VQVQDFPDSNFIKTQGINALIALCQELAYWVGMQRDIVGCTHCFKCQVFKAPSSNPAPLQPVISNKPWIRHTQGSHVYKWKPVLVGGSVSGPCESNA